MSPPAIASPDTTEAPGSSQRPPRRRRSKIAASVLAAVISAFSIALVSPVGGDIGRWASEELRGIWSVGPVCTDNLIPGGLRLTNDAQTAEIETEPLAHVDKAFVLVRVDQHGFEFAVGPRGDESAIAFKQDGQLFAASLAMYGRNGSSGMFLVAIPLHYFISLPDPPSGRGGGKFLSLNKPIDGMTIRMWHEGASVVDFESLQLCSVP